MRLWILPIYEGSGKLCHLEAPLLNKNKAQIVELGLNLGAPYQYTWSCYEGGDRPCGECGTCIDRANAFKANGVDDPAFISKNTPFLKGVFFILQYFFITVKLVLHFTELDFTAEMIAVL